MLTTLRIRNLVVVAETTLSFGPGLNVLTGSTGAGKSLILSAVNLLLGEKASSELIREGEDSASVEAVFSGVRELLGADYEFEFATSDSVTVRREVRRNGRSQAYIENAPVTLRQLRKLCSRLIEPHGQNEQLRLKDAENHISYVDDFANNADELEKYQDAFAAFAAAEQKLTVFESRIQVLREKQELLSHRIEEIGRIAPAVGEKGSIEQQLDVMANAEKIFETLAFAVAALDDDEVSAGTAIWAAERKLSAIAPIDDRLENMRAGIETAAVSIREYCEEMRSYLDGLEFDPQQLADLQERLGTLLGLERRYGMSLDEIVSARDLWIEELDGLAFEDEEREKLRSSVRVCREELNLAGDALTSTRVKSAQVLSGLMTDELNELMMKGASFRIEVDHQYDATGAVQKGDKTIRAFPDGLDVVRMMVTTNPGSAEGGVERIASTGEVSRIALALKHLSTRSKTGSVLIFDEIDAGVGADLGNLIAEKLLALSDRYQIICITHLPQIAARGHQHQVVEKTSSTNHVSVEVRDVRGDARRCEIARMLGGAVGSSHRMSLAAELLDGARHAPKKKRARSSAG